MKPTRLTSNWRWASAVLLTLGFCHVTAANTAQDERESAVVERFLADLDSQGDFTADQKSEVQTIVERLRAESPQDAITESLVKLYPDYAAAVAASDDDDAAAAIERLTTFTQSNNKFLAADASFYLARTLMNNEQFEEAMPLLTGLNGELGKFTVHQGSSQFFIGVAQAGLLENDAAIQSFMQFLNFNPNAPERLRVSAWRQVQSLQAIKDGQLDDVYQRMDYSRRRLELEATDEATQDQQDKIVDMLTKLIKEEEKKECSSNCKKGGT